MSIQAVTYSDSLKSVLWTPFKTGSIHATFIFTHFDFMTDLFNEETLEIVNNLPTNHVQHHHDSCLLDIHKDYDVICTTRNPYRRFLSGFFYLSNFKKEELTVMKFREYFANKVDDPHLFPEGYFGYRTIPKYFIKLENLYESYIQIPFIRESKLNQCGLLYDLCNKKINESQKSVSTKDYFTTDMVDYFYSNYKNLFEIDGYEKDSYKKFN